MWWALVLTFGLCTGVLRAAVIPSVSSFTPTSGKPGTSVKITGSNFTGAQKVTFNGVAALFYVESDTIIRATVSEDALTGVIGVENSDGGGSSSVNFSVSPRINSFTPGSGVAGTEVTIEGANFVGAATTVSFGGVAASPTVTSASQLKVNIPTGATNAPIIIATAYGSATSTNDFIISSQPVIRAITPTIGAIGTTVVIDGDNFANATNVYFNGVAVSAGYLTAPSQLQVVVPSGATTGPIEIRTPTGNVTSTNNFITGTKPIITGFSPAGASVGTQIIITGINFTGTSAVKFNGVSASFGATADSQIQAVVPSGATTGPISITNPNGTGSSSSNFVVGPLPKITSVNVNSGSVGAQVAISGENLLAGSVTLRFGEKAASFTETGQNGSQISATVPSGATTGYITASNSLGIAYSPELFVVVGSAPVILSFDPKTGAPGSQVTLNGFGFSGATAIKLKGLDVVNPQLTSASGTNQISATIPPSALSGTFTVTSSSGTGTSADTYYVWQRIGGFNPATNVTGTSLVVTGANFTGTSQVRLGDTPASFTVDNNGQLTVTVPSQAVTSPVIIKTPAGLMTTITNFVVLPKIDSLTPDRGRAGDSVQINGSGFFNVTAVTFNGISASFTNNSVNLITATAPAGVDSGTVKVVTAVGSATSPSPFLVYATITDFSPKSGPIGTNIIISGINFLDVTNVTISDVTASFSVDSATRITATLPTTKSGVIKLMNPAGIESSDELVFQIQPQMSLLTLSGGDLVFQWPEDTIKFQLQSTPSLSSPISWTDVTSLTYTNAGVISTTNTPAGSSLFYRLKLKP